MFFSLVDLNNENAEMIRKSMAYVKTASFMVFDNIFKSVQNGVHSPKSANWGFFAFPWLK